MEIRKLILKTGMLTVFSTSILPNKINVQNINNTIKVEQQGKEVINKQNIINIEKNYDVTLDNYEQEIKKERQREKKELLSTINEYCNIFSLDSFLVSSKIMEYTNSFNTKLWVEENKIVDDDIDFDTQEQAIIYFIRSINKNYQNYGFDSSVFIENDYEISLECEQLVEKYCNIFDIKKEIAMAIIYTESGNNLDSYNFTNRNNPAGAGHTNYTNLEVGIIYHIINLKYNYGKYNLDGISFFNEAQKKYCPDNDGRWISSNEYFYNKLEEDYYYLYNERHKENKVLTK